MNWTYNAVVIATRVCSPLFIVVILWQTTDSVAYQRWWVLAIQIASIAINLATGYQAWTESRLR